MGADSHLTSSCRRLLRRRARHGQFPYPTSPYHGMQGVLVLLYLTFLLCNGVQSQSVQPTVTHGPTATTNDNGTTVMDQDPERPIIYEVVLELLPGQRHNLTIPDLAEDPPPTLAWVALQSNASAFPAPLSLCTHKEQWGIVKGTYCDEVEEDTVWELWEVDENYFNKTEEELVHSLMLEIKSSSNMTVNLDFPIARVNGTSSFGGSGGGRNTGLIIGVIFGGGGGIGVAVAIWCCCRRRKGGNNPGDKFNSHTLTAESVKNPLPNEDPGIMENGLAEVWKL
eukprot:gb/GECG01016588.1/.p1 GENE.gb/GECG01016588.1/~~gb/GECG01016588.1/.p1  ORF type:complete len:282 (+),score=33.92 gb/GECG01016588.1/:1-846(+)